MTGREDPPPEAHGSRADREDAAWRSIVENFGERAELPDPPPAAPVAARPAPDEPEPLAWEDEGHYVPPPPPPVPRPHGVRLAAWFGVFGVPAVALLLVVVGVSIPSLLGLLLIVWFVAGFGYLVATMSGRDPDSGWDDGAVL